MVVCAHNEANYIEDCLKAILAQRVPPSEIVLVLDRCTDSTGELATPLLEGVHHTILRKEVTHWNNSISENLELARAKARNAGFVVIDADMVIPAYFLEKLLPELREYSVVSAVARTDPSRGLLNWLVSWWERTYRIAPMGTQPRGGARVISKRDLDEVGGFRDVYAWETDLDNRLKKSGREVKLDANVVVLHRRKMTLLSSVQYEIEAGRARRELGISISRTILHSLVRLRPFVIYGYLKPKRENHPSESEALGSRHSHPKDSPL